MLGDVLLYVPNVAAFAHMGELADGNFQSFTVLELQRLSLQDFTMLSAAGNIEWATGLVASGDDFILNSVSPAAIDYLLAQPQAGDVEDLTKIRAFIEEHGNVSIYEYSPL